MLVKSSAQERLLYGFREILTPALLVLEVNFFILLTSAETYEDDDAKYHSYVMCEC